MGKVLTLLKINALSFEDIRGRVAKLGLDYIRECIKEINGAEVIVLDGEVGMVIDMDEAPYGWTGWYNGPDEPFWSADKPPPHELVDDVRPATAHEKWAFNRIKELEPLT